jgi:hypothetical protein
MLEPGISRNPNMSKYEFTLTFGLPADNDDPEMFVEALAKAGCDDATVGIGRRRFIALDFTRGGRSAYDAITSAFRDVRKAIPHAQLMEAALDRSGQG